MLSCWMLRNEPASALGTVKALKAKKVTYEFRRRFEKITK